MALDIRQTKGDLAELIKRRLGAPVVKVELDTQQIYDAIDYAKQKWVKWGVGNAFVETYFTTLLLAGENFYDLPIGVIDISDYEDQGSDYGINTLFTMDNFLYSRGLFDPLLWTGGYGYNLVSYHVALDFLKTVDRYTPSIYNYKYHKYTNQLEVHPAPPSGNALEVVNDQGQTVTVDSPGFVLIRSYMIEGSHYGGMETDLSQSSWKRQNTGLYNGDSDSNFYTSDWIFDYALAECKIILGRIRSKFSQFNSIGNVGIALDGEQLIQEGIQEKETLDERLRLEEGYEGYGILWG
jgi:hypothetical protein